MKHFILIFFGLCISSTAFSQDLATKANWFNLDYQQDGVRGMSVERAYTELLKGRTSQTVIVGIVDSGVDIEHEDLKEVIWVNENEIPGNGIDDDKNGFIDDVTGWDFIGGSDGTDVGSEQLESARLMRKYDKFFTENPKKATKKKYIAQYNDYQKIKREIDEKKAEATRFIPLYEGLLENFISSKKLLKEALGTEELSRSAVEGITNADVEMDVRQAKQFWLRLRNQGADEEAIQEGIDHFNNQLNYNFNTNLEARSVVGDNPAKLEYGKYGNNEVRGPRALHGTHVAGIVAANRVNTQGMKGVADNVKIMVVRTVPDGDELDKDVANAIRYAVDNGAQIINMSFGKPYSPQKNWVDKAVKYAEKKGVLLVAAAGNDGTDIDVNVHYPSKYYMKGGEASNWISVGASSYMDGADMIATFSNYGKKGVDVFAPGVAIYSSVPDSEYKELQGTSMASPAVAGVAALLKSYFPSLTAVQLKQIILSSAEKVNVEVNLPGGENQVSFATLSTTGGVVNAYNAVKMAIEMTEK